MCVGDRGSKDKGTRRCLRYRQKEKETPSFGGQPPQRWYWGAAGPGACLRPEEKKATSLRVMSPPSWVGTLLLSSPPECIRQRRLLCRAEERAPRAVSFLAVRPLFSGSDLKRLWGREPLFHGVPRLALGPPSSASSPQGPLLLTRNPSLGSFSKGTGGT